MKTTMHIILLLATSWMGLPSIAQSKKDIIAAQNTAIDSIFSVCEQQHSVILKAQKRIEDLMEQSTQLKLDLEVLTVANDTLRSLLALQKRVTYASRVSRPILIPPSMDPERGVIDRRSALIHFTSAEEPDHVILETKGVDVLTGITTLRVFDPDRELIFEQIIETTTIDELNSDPALQRCIVSHRLSEVLSQATLIPVARDRNGEWQPVSPDLIPFLPELQCGILVRDHIDDPRATLIVFDRSSKQVVRVRNSKR